MDAFPLTRKKFLALSYANRNRWIVKWLGDVYQQLITNRHSQETRRRFYDNYGAVLKWMGRQPAKSGSLKSNRDWVEFVSDAVHFHRIEAGLSPRDPDLLDAVAAAGRTGGAGNRINLNYSIALDGLRSAFNVGSIFRLCDAAGFRSVILGRTPGSEHPAVRKTAMGAEKWVDSENSDDLASTLTEKKGAGACVVGVETTVDSVAYNRFSWPDKGIVVLGNEEYGISTHVLKVCDGRVHIPMFGRKNSVNVANAAAVVLFYVAAARIKHPGQAI